MKNIIINMSDIGYGANRLGIQHGYIMIREKYPKLASEINYLPHTLLVEDIRQTNKKFYNTVYQATLNIYEANLNSIKENNLPILLGGDHSLALGSVKASIKANENEDIGLIWIDAHADLNTFEISKTGHIHGMPVSGLLGINDEKYNTLGHSKALKTENLVYFATRMVDPEEEVLIHENNILNITHPLIKAISFEESIKKIIEHLKGRVNKIHVSLDLDAINPDDIKGVSTPVEDGLLIEQPLQLIKSLKKEFEIVAFDIVEFNPITDIDEKTIKYVNTLIGEIKNLYK